MSPRSDKTPVWQARELASELWALSCELWAFFWVVKDREALPWAVGFALWAGKDERFPGSERRAHSSRLTASSYHRSWLNFNKEVLRFERRVASSE